MTNKEKLKILFVASEAAPYAKAGGLGDVMYSLPLALKKLGHDPRVMIPRYGTIDPAKFRMKTEINGLKVPTDQPGNYAHIACNVKKISNKQAVPFYFLENMEYYEKRANVYGYSDDHIRWALLCRGTLEFLRHSAWLPDVIMASDWQTALIPDYLKNFYNKDKIIGNIPVVYAIHNLSFQGMCDFQFVQESDRDLGRERIPDFFNPRLANINWALRGIVNSDAVITVSPTYAREILTPEYGKGLEKILFEHQSKLFGILNGIDYQKCDPSKSPGVPVSYSLRSIKRKIENKAHLQQRMGVAVDNKKFLIGIVSRLTEQKGFDLLEPIIGHMFKNLPVQLVVVGDGEPRYKEMLYRAKEKYPESIGYHFNFDHTLPYLVFAGADAVLIPSKFEPCGIVQMEAMRFGCIPIVRKTGGLADTVKDCCPRGLVGNGFVFSEYDSWSLLITIIRAGTVYSFQNIWEKIVRNAMQKDFSWKKSAVKYIEIFHKLAEKKQ